jgi:hypothetical protein
MSGRFYAVGFFYVPSRRLFVVVGDVVAGGVAVGDTISLDLGHLKVGAPIDAVEVISVDYLGKSYLGLAFGFDDAEDLEFWHGLRISGETLEFHSRSAS